MIEGLRNVILQSSSVASTVISISFMLFFGFAVTRITKKFKLPNVTAYILAGIMLGPFFLNLIPEKVINGMEFLADIALAIIAFSTGEFFKFEVLKKNGSKVLIITILEALLASLLVFLLTYFVLKLNLAFSLVLSALASATAPASTVMTIKQTGAKGDFVDTLLQVVALDDVVGLVLYSVAISVAIAIIPTTGVFSIINVIKPILVNLLVLLAGGLFGVLLKILMPKSRSTDNRLIILISLLFAFCGICALLDVSPLLGCMSMGMIYVNLAKDDKLFKQLNYFSPPILLLFFVRSGLTFKLDSLIGTSATIGSVSLLMVGVLYFIVRIIGKYIGAYIGCLITKKDEKIRNYLGLALIPQAGVAIGLAALGARTLGGEMGTALETIVLASSVLYELIGPGLAKLSLYLSKSYTEKTENSSIKPDTLEESNDKLDIQLLIKRLDEIQEELRKHDENILSEEEQAFLEAAEEQYETFETIEKDVDRGVGNKIN